MTPALLDESLDALLEPVTAAALKSVAANLPRTDRIFGFLMPGNVPGAGIHEVCAALLAGAGLIIKSASSEPLFFANFMRTLAEVDATVAARVAVVNFARADDAAMRELWARLRWRRRRLRRRRLHRSAERRRGRRRGRRAAGLPASAAG